MDLQNYLKKFQNEEEIILSKYEKLDLSLNKIYNPTNISNLLKNYETFYAKEKLTSEDFNTILETNDINLYNYYIKYHYIYFIIINSLKIKNKSKILYTQGLQLTENSELYFSIRLFACFFESLELGPQNQVHFYKKRLVKKVFAYICKDFNKKLFFNKSWFDTQINDFMDKYLIFVVKFSSYLELNFVKYGVAKGIIDYSLLTSFSLNNSITEVVLEEVMLDVDNEEESSLNINDINYEKEQILDIKERNFLSHHSSVSTLNHTLVNSHKNKKYTNYGKRKLVFSNQLVFMKNISNIIYFNIPKIYSEYAIFDDFKYYFIIHNKHNPQESSRLRLDVTCLTIKMFTSILFSKSLFKAIIPFLTAKSSENIESYLKLTILSILNIFKLYFLNTNSDYITVYIPQYCDFRGRIYMDTELSITTHKFLRHLISTQAEKQSNSPNKFVYFLEKYLYLLPPTILQKRRFSKNDKIILLLGFLNLGKFCKNQLIIDAKVNIITFIQTGLNIYATDITDWISTHKITDMDDIISLTCLKTKIQEFILLKKNFNIIVDSTASGIFHLHLWLNAKNSFKECLNLVENENWFDTYSYILIAIQKTLSSELFSKYSFLLTRKRIKIIFMTLPYNATHYRLLDYLFKDIESVKDVCFKTMSREEYLEIRKFFILFIDTSKNFFNDFFTNKISFIYKHPLIQNKFEFTLSGNYYDFNYYELKVEEHSVMLDGIRRNYTLHKLKTTRDKLKEERNNNLKTQALNMLLEDKIIEKTYELYLCTTKLAKKKKIKEFMRDQNSLASITFKKNLTLLNMKFEDKQDCKNTQNYILNKKKTERAFIANVMHCTDALFLQKIYLKASHKKIYIQTIHDEFICPVDQYCEFLEIVCAAYEELYLEINQNTCQVNSFFILL